jgi:hypothetical protein
MVPDPSSSPAGASGGLLVYELANFMLFFIVTLWVASMPARTPLLWSTWLAIEVALGVREWNRRGRSLVSGGLDS